MKTLATTHETFWRLPGCIRHKYNEQDIRRVDIIGEGTAAVVLILLANGHTDTWSWSNEWDKMGWQKRKEGE